MAPTGRVCALTATRGDFLIQEYSVPRTQPGTLLVRMELAGVCATDAHVYEGHWPNLQYPVVLGHENVGIVEALGDGVDADFFGNPLRIGDRIVFKAGSCGRCRNCVLGVGGRGCLNRGASYGFRGPSTAPPHFTGGFGQYVYLDNPNTEVFRVELDPQTAVLTEPTAVAVSGVMRANIELGDTAVIQGAGAIGLLTLVCARLAGATQTIVVGGPRRRLELARELGADHVVPIDEVTSAEERIRYVRDLTPGGEGADVVFGCVGVAAAVPEGMRFLKRGSGRMIEVGNALESGQASFSPAADLVSPNVTLVGHWATNTPHWVRALRILQSGRAPFREIVSHQIALSRVGDAIQALLGGYVLDGEQAIKIAIAPNGT